MPPHRNAPFMTVGRLANCGTKDGGDTMASDKPTDAELRAEIIARWNAKQQRKNLFTNISEEQVRRAIRRERAKRNAQ